jgi:hypothetical protein
MTHRVLCALAGFLGTTAMASAEMIWGANGHPLTAYPGISVAEQLDLMADLGMTSYRVNIPDASRMELVTELVQEGKARGVDILPVLTPGQIDLDRDNADELYRKSYEFAVAISTPFKDDIRVWELGNEMENYAIIQPCETRDDGTQYPCEWGPAGGVGALDYYGPRWDRVSAVLKGLSDGIDAVDPTLVTAMGTAGWGHIGAFERMQQDGIEWDITVWHMYGQDPEWAFKELVRYERPIWITELNHPYGSRDGEKAQAEGLTLTLKRLRELQEPYAVEAVHIYELLDEPYWAPDFEAVMGLVRLEETEDGGWKVGEPKPAYHAVRDLLRDDASVRDCALGRVPEGMSLAVHKASYAHCLVLGREPEAGGADAYAAELESGQLSVGDMLLAMLNSDEFTGRYSALALTNSEYVALLYRVLLGREPDPYGLDSYTQELTSGAMTRAGVALGLIHSSEFVALHDVLLESDTASATPTPG